MMVTIMFPFLWHIAGRTGTALVLTHLPLSPVKKEQELTKNIVEDFTLWIGK